MRNLYLFGQMIKYFFEKGNTKILLPQIDGEAYEVTIRKTKIENGSKINTVIIDEYAKSKT